MEALSFMDGKYTFEEISKMDDHAELVNNQLVVTNGTTFEHNNAVLEIATAFKTFIATSGGNCKVATDTVPLICDDLCDQKGNYFLPDVMVICDKNGIKNGSVHVTPKFIAEVTSKSTKAIDYNDKCAVYREIGVPEYWIVDLQKKLIIKNVYDDGVYMPEMIRYSNETSLSVETYPGLTIDLKPIFEI